MLKRGFIFCLFLIIVSVSFVSAEIAESVYVPENNRECERECLSSPDSPGEIACGKLRHCTDKDFNGLAVEFDSETEQCIYREGGVIYSRCHQDVALPGGGEKTWVLGIPDGGAQCENYDVSKPGQTYSGGGCSTPRILENNLGEKFISVHCQDNRKFCNPDHRPANFAGDVDVFCPRNDLNGLVYTRLLNPGIFEYRNEDLNFTGVCDAKLIGPRRNTYIDSDCVPGGSDCISKCEFCDSSEDPRCEKLYDQNGVLVLENAVCPIFACKDEDRDGDFVGPREICEPIYGGPDCDDENSGRQSEECFALGDLDPNGCRECDSSGCFQNLPDDFDQHVKEIWGDSMTCCSGVPEHQGQEELCGFCSMDCTSFSTGNDGTLHCVRQRNLNPLVEDDFSCEICRDSNDCTFTGESGESHCGFCYRSECNYDCGGIFRFQRNRVRGNLVEQVTSDLVEQARNVWAGNPETIGDIAISVSVSRYRIPFLGTFANIVVRRTIQCAGTSIVGDQCRPN